jgi:hypothetical protein
MNEKDFAIFLTKNETMVLIEALSHPSLTSVLPEAFKGDIDELKIKAKGTLKLHLLDDEIEKTKSKYDLFKEDLSEP